MRNYLFLINETINYIVGYSRMKYLYKGGGGGEGGLYAKFMIILC